MQRIAVLRRIAVLALVALGACDAAVNPAAPDPAAARPLGVVAMSSPTVTNSGGYPLISWAALAGATSYSVVLRNQRTVIDKATFATQTQDFDYPLGSTTGTSFLDSAHAYTGKNRCTSYGTYTIVITVYTYRVTATFPDGTSVEL